MSKLGQEILEGLQEALDYSTGKKTKVRVTNVKIPDKISALDVLAIQKKTGLSREKFAECFGFTVRTLQGWELGKRSPQGSSRTLLVLVDRDPKTIQKILARPSH